MLNFQFSPQTPKYLRLPMFPSHPLSTSTHVTPCSMADHQALPLNLHGQSFSSSSPPTTQYCRNSAKIKSRPKLSQNQIATKTQNPTKSQIKSHPPKSKHKTHKKSKSQNENTKVNPSLKNTYIDFVIIFQKKNHLVELILDPN